MTDERRLHPRFPVDLQAKVLHDGEILTEGRTMDVSFSGISIVSERADDLAPGRWVEVELWLVFDWAESKPLKLPAKIVWSTPVEGQRQIGASFAPDLTSLQLARLDVLLQFLAGEGDAPEA